jgi:hypothetical protein
MFEQDDVENWTSITSVSKGHLSAQTLLDNSMGLGPEGGVLHEPIPGWPGPGRAIQGYGEYNQREFLAMWADYLAMGPVGPEPAR